MTKTTNDFDDDFSKIRKYSAVTIAVRLLLRFVIFFFKKKGGAVTITVRLTFGKIRYMRECQAFFCTFLSPAISRNYENPELFNFDPEFFRNYPDFFKNHPEFYKKWPKICEVGAKNRENPEFFEI